MKIQRSNKPPTSEAEVAKLEKKLGYSLDQGYRQFLLKYNGGVPENTLFTIPDCKGEALVDHFLGVERPDENIQDWINELRAELPEGFIPIGFDPGGNAILMDLTDATIYYWDSARFFPQSTDDDNTFWIANSFAEMLKQLRS